MAEPRRTSTATRQRNPDRDDRIPIFSRLGIIHGITLTGLVLLAMSAITYQQLRETMTEIRRSSVDKGRAVATALTPLILRQLDKKDELQRYFDEIDRMADIDYIQVVDSKGAILASSSPSGSERAPEKLDSDWMKSLGGNDLDAIAVPVPWHNDEAGIDVFVALLENSSSASSTDVRAAKHLRIGVNFNDVVQQDMPRVIRRMLLFSIAIALIMLAGLIVMLQHIMRPLKELRKGLRAVANGDLNYQVPVFSQDEVGSLVKAYNGTIHRLRYAFEQIESLATLDPLTGLSNRRVFDERIAIEAKRSRRYGHPFGLIMLDLDHFKQINDRFGHPAGDEVLRLVAKTIEAGVRETDLVARIGGEEFAVILPESKAPEVRAVAEKLRVSVEDIQFTPGDGHNNPVRITISAGAACALGRLVTTEGLVAATDAALYRSKAEGRNRVTMAERVSGGSGINPGIQV